MKLFCYCSKIPATHHGRKERFLLCIGGGVCGATRCHVTQAALKLCVVGTGLEVLVSNLQPPSAEVQHTPLCSLQEKCASGPGSRNTLCSARKGLAAWPAQVRATGRLPAHISAGSQTKKGKCNHHPANFLLFPLFSSPRPQLRGQCHPHSD